MSVDLPGQDRTRITKLLFIFREKATSALAGFHAGPLSRSNWNVEMLIFQEGGKLKNLEKNPWSKGRTNNKLDPHIRLALGIEPGPHWWEASALTTAPSLLPTKIIAAKLTIYGLKIAKSLISYPLPLLHVTQPFTLSIICLSPRPTPFPLLQSTVLPNNQTSSNLFTRWEHRASTSTLQCTWFYKTFFGVCAQYSSTYRNFYWIGCLQLFLDSSFLLT